MDSSLPRVHVAVASLAPRRIYASTQLYARVAAAAYAGAPSSHPDAHLTARAVYDETESNSQTIWGAEELARRVDAACGRPGTWSSSVWPSIRTVISDTFALLVDRAQTDSPLSSGGCRALYGVDVMLAEDAHWRSPRGEADGRTPQPVLLEVNYSPDLTSVLRLYPRFVDGLFERLFDEVGPSPAPRGDDERERAHVSWEEL